METIIPRPSEGLQGADIAAALQWWREAGVDCDFSDSATTWLVEPAADSAPPPTWTIAPAPEVAAVPAQSPFGGDQAGWPASLDRFGEWWLAEPRLDDGAVRDRVAPRGQPGAACMIVVPQPEAVDREQLLSGPEGTLLQAILGAAGLPPESAYVASVVPRHRPALDWAGLAAQSAGAVLRHHIALVRPARLLVFGSGILPLLGHDPTHNAQNLPTFNHEGLTIPLLPARELAALIARPAWKAGFWRNWLDWTGTASA